MRTATPNLRNILFPFSLVLVLSIAVISGLTVIAARSQDEAATRTSIHLARSVIGDIQRRLAEQLLDYSYWDEAVNNLVERPNLNWADKNVGIYMHDRFQISASFVIDADDKTRYAMVAGTRRDEDALRFFSGGLRSMLAAARGQPKNQPPVPVTGILSDGRTAHLVAASTLTGFANGHPPGRPIATGSTLVFARALDAKMLDEISRNYLLEDLRFVNATEMPHRASLPIGAYDGTPIGHLTWRPDSLGDKLLANVLPAIALAFVLFGVAAFVFYRRAQVIAGNLARDNEALRAARLGLLRAKEEAEGANRAKTSFLANVSHEFRTPLNAIIGFSDVVRHQSLGPLRDMEDRYLEYISHINDSGSHLLHLINDILDVSKIESGTMEMTEDAVDLVEAINAVVEMVAERAAAGAVDVSVAADLGLPRLRGDSLRVKQILLNLVGNAIKFTRPGGTVTVDADGDESLGVILTVSDTGIGIPPEDLPMITEPFIQASGPRDPALEGTGLGLTLVKSLAAMHDSEIFIESEVGVGTNVTVKFPAARVVKSGEAAD